MLVTQPLVSPVVQRAHQKCSTLRSSDGATALAEASTLAASPTKCTGSFSNSSGSSTAFPKEKALPSWSDNSICNKDALKTENNSKRDESTDDDDECDDRVMAMIQRGTSPLPSAASSSSLSSSTSSLSSSPEESIPALSTEQTKVAAPKATTAAAAATTRHAHNQRPLAASLPAALPSSSTHNSNTTGNSRRLRSSLRSSNSIRSSDGIYDDDFNRRGDGMRRTVSFGDTSSNTIIHIEHVNKIHRRERSRRWFNSMDLAYQRSENDPLLEVMERTGSFNEKTCLAKLKETRGNSNNNIEERFTIRGLERQTIQGKTQYYEQYRDAVMAVLVQQQMVSSAAAKKKKRAQQQQHDAQSANAAATVPNNTDELIAASYQRETAHAQKLAAQQGRHDAKEVRDYLSADDCHVEAIRLKHLSERQREQQRGSVVSGLLLLRKPFVKSNRTTSSSTLSHDGSTHRPASAREV